MNTGLVAVVKFELKLTQPAPLIAGAGLATAKIPPGNASGNDVPGCALPVKLRTVTV